MSIVHHTNRDIENRARQFNELKARVKSLEQTIIKIQGGGIAIEDTTGQTESAIVLNDITDLVAIAGENLSLNGVRLDVKASPDLDSIKFNTLPNITPIEGELHYNPIDKTLNVSTDTDTTIQVGQEVVVRIINKTGGELTNGEVVFINSADVTADRPTAIEADASTWEESQLTIGVMTSTVDDDAEGFVTITGLVRDVNTNGMTAGDRLYLSETTGAYTNVRPSSPAFIIDVGVVIKVGVSDGIIFVHVNNNDDGGFFNKSFIQQFDCTITEDGGNIVASLERTGGGNLTMRFSDGFSTLVTAPMTKNLTAGTAILPQANYLYILQSDKTQITLDLDGYPADVEHIKIAKIVVLTAAITATDDALANQNVNDHALDHMSHIGEWIRSQPASYVSPGIDGDSSTGDEYLEIETVPDAIYFRSTAGTTRQLHLQIYPAKDTDPGGSGDFIYVVNDPDAAYTKVTELIAGIDKLATGAALSNNKYFARVVWGIQNKSGETSQLMCNLPLGEYLSQAKAENDADGHTVFDIPTEFRGTGFLICKIVIQKKATTWEHKSTKDLRGTNPSSVSGGGSTHERFTAAEAIEAARSDLLDEDDLVSDSDVQAATQQSIKAYSDIQNIVGAANADQIICLFVGSANDGQAGYILGAGLIAGQASVGSITYEYQLTYPTSVNGKALTLTDIEISLFAADATDFITRVRVFGTINQTQTLKFDDTANHQAPGIINTGDELIALTNFDASSFSTIAVFIQCTQATNNELKIAGVNMTGYYS